jgi:hypothetical protein
MDETVSKLLEAIAALGAELRTEVADGMAKISQRCDALDERLKKADEAGVRRKKADGDDDDMAEQTAADRRADSMHADMRHLQNRVNAMDIHSRQNAGTRDQFANLQSRADVAYRSWSESAPPPMSGEGVLDYAIRLHRPLMKHSKKFAKADLLAMARDPATLNTICDQIRADAVEASMSPVGMPEFQHREIVQNLPTGHIQRTWVGNGTVFKQMSRPVRHVKSIGADPRFPRSAGGSVHAPLQ